MREVSHRGPRQIWGLVAAVSAGLTTALATADEPVASPPTIPMDKLTAGAKTSDGFLRVHVKDQHLYAEIPPTMLDRPMIWPVAISRGIGFGELIGGMTLNFDDDWVMVFRQVGDSIHLVRRNVRFRAKPGTPTAAAVERAYTDSTLAAMRIITRNPARGTMVVDLAEVLLNDLAGISQALPGYFADRQLSTFHKVKNFPENLEIQVAGVYRSQGRFRLPTVADPRSVTVHVHFSLSLLPTASNGYRPRLADDRVGYFLTAVKDFTTDAGESNFVRYVNRWHLEKSDPAAKLSVPKKPIRFWIERTVPLEYRRFVREGVLEWNRAFEKIGFVDAIEVRQQDEADDFDPEDIRFNTIRWITSDAGFAIGPSRVNPMTGEILDADILMDASMVRFEREEYELFVGDPTKLADYAVTEHDLPPGVWDRLRSEETARRRSGPADAVAGWLGEGDKAAVGSAVAGPVSIAHPAGMGRFDRFGRCQCRMACGLRREMAIAVFALAERGDWKPGQPVPLEFVGQSIKHTIMHEVGHTLGLRHNFKASSIVSLDALNDAKTRDTAQVGSVMDYIPVNVQPKGRPQGNYFPQVVGPYDLWAIEYGYSPEADTNPAKLAEIASRAAEPQHAYATDEDTYRPDSDALSNVWDIGDDPLAYGIRRIELLRQLLDGLSDKVVAKGESWQRSRRALAMLLGAQSRTATYAANLVGGHLMHRDHKGDPNGRPPIVMISAARQRQALKYLRENVFDESAFRISPEVVSRLAPSRWEHWGTNAMGGDLVYPIHDAILGTQRAALYQLMAPANLRRIREGELTVPPGEDYLTLAELFRTVTDGVWSDALAELPDRAFNDRAPLLSAFRRALQREHVELLSAMALDGRGGTPADVKSLARLQMRRVLAVLDIDLPGRLGVAARANKTLDDLSDAHLHDLRERIRKVLEASVSLAR